MAVTTTAAIASTAAAGTSSDITVDAGASVQVWVSPSLGAGEKVVVWRTNGESPETAERAQDGGRPIEIGGGINSLCINGPGTFRLTKTATATATVVYYDA